MTPFTVQTQGQACFFSWIVFLKSFNAFPNVSFCLSVVQLLQSLKNCSSIHCFPFYDISQTAREIKLDWTPQVCDTDGQFVYVIRVWSLCPHLNFFCLQQLTLIMTCINHVITITFCLADSSFTLFRGAALRKGKWLRLLQAPETENQFMLQSKKCFSLQTHNVGQTII